mmetsp:Transcript_61712/g.176992  ORF Transcript_61712/g.176992 Transcript_61712/m.176992 type:complete len:228 (+) Transcript_61712:686-1369(+)
MPPPRRATCPTTRPWCSARSPDCPRTSLGCFPSTPPHHRGSRNTRALRRQWPRRSAGGSRCGRAAAWEELQSAHGVTSSIRLPKFLRQPRAPSDRRAAAAGAAAMCRWGRLRRCPWAGAPAPAPARAPPRRGRRSRPGSPLCRASPRCTSPAPGSPATDLRRTAAADASRAAGSSLPRPGPARAAGPEAAPGARRPAALPWRKPRCSRRSRRGAAPPKPRLSRRWRS